MRIVSEAEFSAAIRRALAGDRYNAAGWVTGPGRSGAIAAVYASHIMGVPFVPYGCNCPPKLGRPLIIDTARDSGATMRKAMRRYEAFNPLEAVVFEERTRADRVVFWYEAEKPQRYKHEGNAA